MTAEKHFERNANTINRKFAEYFIPTLLVSVASNFALVIDSMLAGNILGGNALAAINLICAFAQIFFATALLFGVGASVLISTAKGNEDPEQVDRIFTVLVLLMALATLLTYVLFVPNTDRICSFLTTDATLYPLVRSYFIPFIWGSPLNIILTSLTPCIRVDGWPKLTFVSVFLANIVNLVLDIFLSTVCGMGISGFALATVFGNITGIVVFLLYFATRKSSLHVRIRQVGTGKEVLHQAGLICAAGASAGLGCLLVGVKLQFLNTLLQKIGGNIALVAQSICSTSNILIFTFFAGVADTMVPIVGICIGEHDYRGVRYAFRKAAFSLLILSCAIGVIVAVLSGGIVMLFGVTEPATAKAATFALMINAISFPFQAFIYLMTYYYTAIGKKQLALLAPLTNGLLVLIPVTLLLAGMFGVTGVWISFSVVSLVSLVILYVLAMVMRKHSAEPVRDFLLLQEKSSTEILSLSFQASVDDAVGVSGYLSETLDQYGVEKNKAMRIAIAAEEITVEACEKNKKLRYVNVDLTVVKLPDKFILMIRNNGLPFDGMTEETADAGQSEEGIDSITMVKKLATNVSFMNTIGFNRISIEF